MKISLIHLSDLHISASNPRIKVEKIANILNNIENEKIILFSGDIAFSGDSDQYKIFENDITQLLDLSGIDKKSFFFIPGNHDIEFEKEKYTFDDFQADIEKGKQFIENLYVNRMVNFYNYAKDYELFVNNPFLDIKEIQFGEYNIRINLLNSGIGSLLKSSKNEKGLHDFNSNVLNELDKHIQADMVVTLMHHATDFFEEKTKRRLEEILIKGTSIFLFGHEHYDDHHQLIDDENKMLQIRGTALFDHKTQECGFNIIDIDTESNTCVENVYKWNKYTNNFDLPIISKPYKIVRPNRSLKIKKETLVDLTNVNEISGINENNVFVFPDLNSKEIELKTISLKTYPQFDKFLKENKIVFIEGEDFSGKSILTRYLYLKYTRNALPVLFTPKNTQDKKPINIVENIYKEQYNQSVYNWSSFLTHDKSEKIAIFDDAHLVKPEFLNALTVEFSKHFGKIIFIARTKWHISFVDLVKESVDDVIDGISLQIEPLTLKKRKELISNVCVEFRKQGHALDVVSATEQINKLITNQNTAFINNPNLIILFTVTYLNGVNISQHGNFFNAVFEANITNTINKDPDLDVATTLIILQNIAKMIHVTKEYPLNQNKFFQVIENYNSNSKGYRVKLDPNEQLNKLIAIKLIKKSDHSGNLVFPSNTLLAYFIAKALVNHKDVENIEKLAKYVCFGINGDILMFISYLTNDLEIIRFMLKEAEEHFDDQEEIDFDRENVKFMLNKISVETLEYSEEAIEEYEQEIEKQEKIIANQAIQVTNIFEYDENTLYEEANVMLKSMKLVELLSRILPDFIATDKPEIIAIIETIVNNLYNYPNKLVYRLLKQVDDHYEDVIRDLNIILSQNKVINNYTSTKQLTDYLLDISTNFMLNVYNLAAKFSSNRQTILALTNAREIFNTNNLIQKLMFLENSDGRKDEFGLELDRIYRLVTFKKEALKKILSKIYYKHVVSNKLPYTGNNQRRIDTYLGGRKVDAVKLRLGNLKGK